MTISIDEQSTGSQEQKYSPPPPTILNVSIIKIEWKMNHIRNALKNQLEYTRHLELGALASHKIIWYVDFVIDVTLNFHIKRGDKKILLTDTCHDRIW